ncbi:MAG TPA: prephenate dehydrogenase/arogenate dehydrogenase family protein, partial [Dehalococcoidia bacterium]|nr:prephenate dehydrogenase/arogenate dehydrogenase family protein [Dehalococcoidia bacterium]
PSLEAAVRDATLVVIATPILNVRRVFEEIAPVIGRGTVVTDTASTKGEVLRWARQILPRDVHFVGGHPMAGKEQSGMEAAEETLFDGRPYVIVPSVDAAPGAVNAVIGLAEAVGGVPYFQDADEHDAYAAAISHVPLVASVGIFNLARGSAAWPELANMAGPAFRDLTRLASGEPTMAHDIFLTNKTNVVHWLERYIGELQRLSQLIETADEEELFRSIAETQLERETFILSPPERPTGAPPAPDVPSPVQSLMGTLAGSLWQSRVKEMTDVLEERQAARAREERLRRQD